MSLPILLEINYILQVWLGDNVPNYTSVFVVVIVLNSFLNNLNSAVSGVVHASGKMKKYQIAGGSISLISVLVVYVAMLFTKIPVFALLIILLMDVIRQIIALIILKTIVPEFSFKRYLEDVIRPVIIVSTSSIVVPLCLHFFLDEGFLRLLLVTIVYLCSIVIAIFLKGLTSNEKSLLKQFLFNIISKFTGKIMLN